MKRIIALFGRGDCGKSETIGVYLRELFHEKVGLRNETIEWKDTREFIKVDSTLIDICPPGDNERIVLENIEFFKKNPFDIAYTSTRSWGKGCQALEKYAKEIGAELIWIKKSYNDDLDIDGQSKENMKLAERLFWMTGA